MIPPNRQSTAAPSDNRYSGPPRVGGYFIDLPPPVIRIPRERYIVDA